MPAQPGPRCMEVRSAGRSARAALAAPARMIAVFQRSGYVENAAGIACIGVAAIGNGPLNAIVSNFPAQAAVGETFVFDLGAAALWAPQPAPRWTRERIAAALERLRGSVPGRLPAEGFGFTLDASAALPPPVQALARWLAGPADASLPASAAGLIGLGPGLTPAGDDLIGGAMCALRAAGRDSRAARLADWALPLAVTRTGRISLAHLVCAAQGECGEAVSDAIVALLGGSDPNLARVDAVGHTSGWDALAGAVMALEALAKS